MNKWIKFTLASLLIISISIVLLSSSQKNEDAVEKEFQLAESVGEENFEKVINPRSFSFPEDFGAHPQFQTEWWYYTGNVFDPQGRQFGYQLTFFRRSIASGLNPTRTSDWATNQVYLAHFTLTDVEGKKHYQQERIARGTLGMAGADVNPLFSVNLFDWNIQQVDDKIFQLTATTSDWSLSLRLEDVKGVILHGDAGVSKKGPQPGNASYYFSQTRLKSSGNVTIEGIDYPVEGYSWMDHEFGTSALGSEQIGWDWFSLQLDNQTEWMLFQIREEDDKISPQSSGTYITRDGQTENLNQKDFQISVLDRWKTGDGFIYPSSWRILSAKYDLDLKIQPLLADQENRFFFRYWEGAVKIEGTMNGIPVSGFGYVELTGYAQSMQGVF